MMSHILIGTIIVFGCVTAYVTGKPVVRLENVTDPCAHIFHVHGLNHEGGGWNIQLGNETGQVNHTVEGRVHDERLAGEWDAQLIERCKGLSTTVEVEQSTESSEETTERHVVTTEGEITFEVTRTTEQILATTSEVVFTTTRSDYLYFPNFGRYKFHTDFKTWDEASKVCQSENAYLVVINSKGEAEIIQSIFEQHLDIDSSNPTVNNEAFIGVRDFTESGSFETVLGGRLRHAGFEEWEPGQPDDFEEDEDCVTFLRQGTLNDIACWRELAFFCEAN